MKPAWRSLLLFRVVPLALCAAVVVWAVWKLDWALIAHKLASGSPLDVAAMGAAWLAALFLRALRLEMLLAAASPETKPRYWPTWSASMIAMAVNSFIPMRAGDMTMAFVLRQALGVPIARGFSAVLVDRFFDFATVIVIFIAALALAPAVVPWAADLTVTLLAALLVLVGGLWLAVSQRRFWLALFDRCLAAVAPRLKDGLGRQVHELFIGIGVVDRLRVMVPVLVLSIGLWGVIIFSYWIGARAFWPPVTFAAAVFAAGAVALSFIVPIAPGGIGVFHAAVVLALSLFGVPTETALAFAIVSHAFQFGSVVVLAALATLLSGISIRSLTAPRQTL